MTQESWSGGGQDGGYNVTSKVEESPRKGTKIKLELSFAPDYITAEDKATWPTRYHDGRRHAGSTSAGAGRHGPRLVPLPDGG